MIIRFGSMGVHQHALDMSKVYLVGLYVISEMYKVEVFTTVDTDALTFIYEDGDEARHVYWLLVAALEKLINDQSD